MSSLHGHVISTAGIPGKHAQHGLGGEEGPSGQDGDHGADAHTPSQYPSNHKGNSGSDGKYGSDATTNGENGDHGSHASPLDVYITFGIPPTIGEEVVLDVSGSVSERVTLSRGNYLLLDASGGNGGHGGDGGAGGQGGKGGNGGNGGLGPPGPHATEYGRNGGDAGIGGAAGNAGNGGDGGNGTNGGNGGNGGNGANITLKVTDSRVLVAVKRQSEGGRGGRAGEAGRAGPGGPPGVAGRGGEGGEGGKAIPKPDKPSGGCPFGCGTGNMTYLCPWCHRSICDSCGGGKGSAANYCLCGKSCYTDPGSHGRKGTKGQDGNIGNSGKDGQSGFPGISGTDGHNGHFVIQVVNNDGQVLEEATEPYSARILSFVLVDENEDGIFEPGASFQVRQVEIYNPGSLTLPAGASLNINSTNPQVRIERGSVDLPEIKPKEKIMLDVNDLVARALDIPILPSGPNRAQGSVYASVSLLGYEFYESRLEQQFLIQYPICLRDGQIPLAISPETATVCKLGVHNQSTKLLEDEIAISFALPAGFSTSSSRVIYNPLDPNFTKVLEYNLLVDNTVGLFTENTFGFTLQLRGHPIERGQAVVRVSPIYNPTAPAKDALLITGSHVSKPEYEKWKGIFDSFKLSMDVWDIQTMGGVSYDPTGCKHPATWAGRYRDKIILWIMASPNDLKMLATDDLLDHFLNGSGEGKEKILDEPTRSSFVIVGANSRQIDDILFTCPQASKFDADTSSFSGLHMPFMEPSNYAVANTVDKLVEFYQNKDKKFRYHVKATDIKPSQVNLVKWQYGDAKVTKMPLPKGTHLLNIENTATDTKFLTALGAILFSLSFPKKLEIFQKAVQPDDTTFTQFKFVSEAKTFSFVDLVWESLFHDLKKEYWSSTSEEFPRLAAIRECWDSQNFVLYYSLLIRLGNASPAAKEDSWAKLPGFFYKKEDLQKKNYEKAKASFQKGLGNNSSSEASDRAKHRFRTRRVLGAHAFPTDLTGKSTTIDRNHEKNTMFWESSTGNLISDAKKLVSGLF